MAVPPDHRGNIPPVCPGSGHGGSEHVCVCVYMSVSVRLWAPTRSSVGSHAPSLPLCEATCSRRQFALHASGQRGHNELFSLLSPVLRLQELLETFVHPQ